MQVTCVFCLFLFFGSEGLFFTNIYGFLISQQYHLRYHCVYRPLMLLLTDLFFYICIVFLGQCEAILFCKTKNQFVCVLTFLVKSMCFILIVQRMGRRMTKTRLKSYSQNLHHRKRRSYPRGGVGRRKNNQKPLWPAFLLAWTSIKPRFQ